MAFYPQEEDRGLRLDVYLKKNLSMSRSQIERLVEEGFIRVQGKQVKPSHKVRPGEKIEIILPEKKAEGLIPEDIPIDIIYRDEHIVVINKPPYIPVYPGPGHPSGTLLNGLLYHLGISLSLPGGPLRPGVVHRLDKDTSGVMVFALSEKAYYKLVEMFRKRELRRRYLCIACGDIAKNEDLLSTPIGRALHDRKKFSTKTRSGKAALTYYKVIERFKIATLLEIFLKTGRTHQIRVHMASIGHPVCGDKTYGRKTFIEIGNQKIKFPRQMLHAESLGFRHPVTGEELDFHSEMPEDMKEAIERLRAYRT
ncbi:MAG: RluA family pseudouridine synthase [Thermodesulfovibrionales bacterium]|nr:RluA family pseudouridine synthase [Thermodesulfovibrionales bacterium]